MTPCQPFLNFLFPSRVLSSQQVQTGVIISYIALVNVEFIVIIRIGGVHFHFVDFFAQTWPTIHKLR